MNAGDVHAKNPIVTGSSREVIKYPFIDFIRFISMIGIVWAHTEAFPQDQNAFEFLKLNGHAESYIFFKQIFKFSVFCFFIISGFLFGDKITSVSPYEYLKRRIDTTLRPYLISLSIFLLFFYLRDILINRNTFTIASFIKSLIYLIVGTPFWFIPTFFISLIVILLFAKYIDSMLFGGILFAITLVYTFPNQYIHEFVHGHTTTFFGYIFYIWFGVYVRRKQLINRFKTYNIYALIIATIILYLLSSFESVWMFDENNKLFFNILRLSNQIYGVVFFILLVRICPDRPNFGFFIPRRETYGVYLYHFFFVAFTFPLIYKWLEFNTTLDFNNTFIVIGISVLHFVLCYLVTTLWVKLLLKYKIPVL